MKEHFERQLVFNGVMFMVVGNFFRDDVGFPFDIRIEDAFIIDNQGDAWEIVTKVPLDLALINELKVVL